MHNFQNENMQVNILLTLGLIKDFQKPKGIGRNTKGKQSINLTQLLYVNKSIKM